MELNPDAHLGQGNKEIQMGTVTHITYRDRSSSALANCYLANGSSMLPGLLGFKRNLDYTFKKIQFKTSCHSFKLFLPFCTDKKVPRPNKQIIRPWATFKP